MKTSVQFIIISLFITLFNNANSQNHTAICEHANWITHFQIGEDPPTEYYYYYKTGGDTVINNVHYFKLFQNGLYFGGPGDTYIEGALHYSYAFRNDSLNRAYIFPENDTIEHLWYDFNLSVGDTLPNNPLWYSCIPQGNYNPNYYIVVKNIDSVLYCNFYHKRYIFNSDGTGNFPDLVQDIGFTGDLINYNVFYIHMDINVMVWSPDSSMSDCFPSFNGIQNNYKNISSKFSFFPNPVKDNLTIETNSNTDQKIEIINLIGQTVYTIYINKKTTINTSAFANGVYILKLSSDKETVVKKFVKE